jgi:hypothetical protein
MKHDLPILAENEHRYSEFFFSALQFANIHTHVPIAMEEKSKSCFEEQEILRFVLGSR